MQRKLLRSIQAVTVLAAMVACGMVLYGRWLADQGPGRFDWHRIPKNGYSENDTHGDVPGNVENGVQGLKKLYAAIQVFRKRHNGNYPALTANLIDDCIRDPSAYNVSNYEDFMDSFNNPDSKYGDGSYFKPDKMMMVSVIGKRPDGTPVGGPKPTGTRDLIGMTSTYFHMNGRIYSESHSTLNPVGWYLLLWDDGTVEKLPYDKMLYVETGSKEWKRAFPGQAGLPPTGVTTYDEWYKAQGWKAGPRGVKNGPGVSFPGG